MLTNYSRIAYRHRAIFRAISVFCAGLAIGYSADSITSSLPENYLPQLSRILDSAMTDSDSMRIRELSEELSLGTMTRFAAPSKIRARGSASYRAERDIKGSDDFGNRIFYNFVLSKSIYHWGELKALRRQGEISNEIERLISFGSYRSLALSIRSSYMELIAKDYEVRIAESEYALQENLFEKERTAFEAGNLSEDRLALTTREKNLKSLAVLKAQGEFERHLLAVAMLTGMSADSLRSSMPATIPEVGILADDTVRKLAASVEKALMASSDIKRLDKSIEDAEQSVKIAQSRLKPKINFESGLTQFDLDNRGVRREEELVYAGIGITWSIWDGSESRGLAQEARSRKELAILQIDQAKRKLDADLKNALNEVEIAKLSLEIEERFLDRGEELLANTKKGVEENTISKQGLEGAQRGVLKQELATIRARANYLNSVARLASLLGLDPVAVKYIASKEV